MRHFFTPEISEPTFELPKEESKHIVQVLRMREGDPLKITNGNGTWYTCEITKAHPKSCSVTVVSKQTVGTERSFYLHMAVAPTKNMQRFEFFVEKAVEFGIDRITPLITEHSERKFVNASRIERVAISALKQSRKAQLTQIDEAITFTDFLQQENLPETKLIAHCEEEEKTTILQQKSAPEQILILIGPEGDFSTQEIEKAKNNGYSAITLGESRLRTETAAIAACHSVHLLHAE